MPNTIMEQALEFRGRYMGVLAISYLDDFKISPSEQKRLDAVQRQIDQIDQKVKDLEQEAQKKLDQAMKDVVGKLKTDASQVKAFQDTIKALSPDVQIAAVDVLNTLCATPRPADPKAEREQIRKALAKFPHHSMEVGKALNAIGVYLPNLKEDSPGAEDASARIKKIHMSAYGAGSAQSDYVRDLIGEAKKQGFKVVLQIKRGADAAATKKIVDDLKKQIAADMAGTIADVKELEKYVEILPAEKQDYVWSEDNKWLSVDGTTIHTSPDISNATLSRANAFTSHKVSGPGSVREGHHAAGHLPTDTESNEFPAGLVDESSLQGAVDDRNARLSAKALAKATGKKVATTRTYNEGGNMLTGTLPNGQPYGVIGRDGVLASVFHIQEEYDNERDPTKKKNHEFDPANVKKRMGTMTFDKQEVDETIERLNAAGFIPSGASGADKETLAKSFLAKIDLVKDIFAKDTKVPREQLIFVAQPDFHIDMHMRPLGPGQIMVNDFDANLKLIDDALKRATPGSWEEKELKSMRDHTTEMKKVMGPVVDEIVKQSKSGGLDVVRAPGVMEGQFEKVTISKTTVYYGEPIDDSDPANPKYLDLGKFLSLAADKDFTRKELADALAAKVGSALSGSGYERFFDRLLDDYFTRHVNFMNAIPGTKDGTNEQYYMTNFTSIKPLREAYEAHLKAQGIEEVRWIGDDGGGQSARSASEESLQASGGLDCRENH